MRNEQEEFAGWKRVADLPLHPYRQATRRLMVWIGCSLFVSIIAVTIVFMRYELSDVGQTVVAAAVVAFVAGPAWVLAKKYRCHTPSPGQGGRKEPVCCTSCGKPMEMVETASSPARLAGNAGYQQVTRGASGAVYAVLPGGECASDYVAELRDQWYACIPCRLYCFSGEFVELRLDSDTIVQAVAQRERQIAQREQLGGRVRVTKPS